jgi:DNA-binding transcriptional regulator PaaX
MSKKHMTSLTQEILRITAKYFPLGYNELYEYLYEETVYGKKLNRRSLSAILSRMKKNGLLATKDGEFILADSGRLRLENVSVVIKSFWNTDNARDNKKKPKKLVIIFDIPEKQKFYRNLLRSELVGFGFTMIQKSVWLGPTLPKEFIGYLNEIGLLKYTRFFQATERDLI